MSTRNKFKLKKKKKKMELRLVREGLVHVLPKAAPFCFLLQKNKVISEQHNSSGNKIPPIINPSSYKLS